MQSTPKIHKREKKPIPNSLPDPPLAPADLCEMPLTMMQLGVTNNCGPSPGVINSLVTLRVGDRVLKLRRASEKLLHNRVGTTN